MKHPIRVHALQRMTLWCCLYWQKSAASLMTDWMLIRCRIVFNTWLQKKTRQDVTPYFCVIPAWHFNALITRKCTMNSTLEILNKYFSWINTYKYQSLIHISLSFQLTKCWAQSFAIGAYLNRYNYYVYKSRDPVDDSIKNRFILLKIFFNFRQKIKINFFLNNIQKVYLREINLCIIFSSLYSYFKIYSSL